ncbi:unnamed protein product [Ectocarpus sp. 12 AP-2014]
MSHRQRIHLYPRMMSVQDKVVTFVVVVIQSLIRRRQQHCSCTVVRRFFGIRERLLHIVSSSGFRHLKDDRIPTTKEKEETYSEKKPRSPWNEQWLRVEASHPDEISKGCAMRKSLPPQTPRHARGWPVSDEGRQTLICVHNAWRACCTCWDLLSGSGVVHIACIPEARYPE